MVVGRFGQFFKYRYRIGLAVRTHISETILSDFIKFSAHFTTCGRGSVLWQRCKAVLCVFVDPVAACPYRSSVAAASCTTLQRHWCGRDTPPLGPRKHTNRFATQSRTGSSRADRTSTTEPEPMQHALYSVVVEDRRQYSTRLRRFCYLRRRRRLCYWFGLFVCLSVCPSDYSQTCERILTKFFGGVGHGSRTK